MSYDNYIDMSEEETEEIFHSSFYHLASQFDAQKEIDVIELAKESVKIDFAKRVN